VPRGKTPEEDEALSTQLLNDEKEKAEHLMLVDSGRNDIGRVAKPGSVRVPRFMQIEKFSHVQHLVSHVTGELRDDMRGIDALRACFPAGTVSGAPKIRAMQIIAELEQTRRGVYAGAVGHLGFNGDLDTCIALRTIVIVNGTAYVAQPAAAWWRQQSRDGVPRELQQGGCTVACARAGRPFRQRGRASMILLIDNYDSFTYNLVQYLVSLGADVLVKRNDALSVGRCESAQAHKNRGIAGTVYPQRSGHQHRRYHAARQNPHARCLFGIRHRGQAFGGIVERAPHGRRQTLGHQPRRPWAVCGLPQHFMATRYHSLIVRKEGRPADLSLDSTAWTDDGIIMGLKHRKYPIYSPVFTPSRL
jgi:anthranilate/para-aminobenzoate synthase component II